MVTQEKILNEKKTLKERREESDARIIRSAVRCFGEEGYSHATLKKIASGAGVTSGLITQRFDTKENLFRIAYEHATNGIFRQVDSNASPRECICTIIEDIINLYEKDRDAFAFCAMLHNAVDLPVKVLHPYREKMKQTNAYRIVADAQKDGMLPDGNLDGLLASLSASVLNTVRLCRRYHMAVPKKEVFLDGIGFTDSIVKNDEKWHHIIACAIDNTFEMLVYVNIPDNTGEMLKHSEKFQLSEKYVDIRTEISRVVPLITTEEEQQRVREHLNIDTLSQRMKNRKSLSIKFPHKDGSYFVHTFLPLSWDENGNLVEVFAGIYEVKENETARNNV